MTQGGGSVSDGQGSGPSVSIPTNAGGVATLTSWTLGTVAGSNALSATAAGTGISGNPVSFTATAAAGAAARVRITTEPSAAAQVGVALATQPQARLVDQFGNAVAQAGTTVSLTVLGGGATLRGGASQVTGAGGTVAWSGLDLVGPVGGYALVASAGALALDTTVTIALGAGPATKLGLATAPGASAQSGALLAPQPAVQVQDLAGNAVAQAGVQVTAAIATGGGTLGGTLTQQSNAGGVATFTDLAISGSSGGRTLAFSAPGLTGVSSGTITIGAGTATQLALTTAPSTTAQSGSLLATQPVVQLRDASNNPVAQAGVAVTVSVSTGGALAGTTTVTTNAQGQAAFSGLAISGPAGSYTLGFAASGLTGVTSAPITLSAGSGAKLAFVTAPPATGQSGQALAPATVVQLLDAADNPVAQAGVSLTATIATGAGGTLGGTPSVTTNAQGQASFANLVLSGATGSYTLAFGGTGLTGVTSAAITLTAGTATQLAFVTPPAAAAQSGVPLTTVPVVQLQDGGGNAVAQAGVGVTVSLASGGGTLGGTTTATTDALGQATFTGLTIAGLAGPRTLGFASTGLTGLTSGTITLSAGPAAALALQAGNGQSAVAGSPVAINPAVKVTDAAGNAVSGVTVNFEVTAGGGSVGAPTVATDGQGLAAQGWTLGSAAGSNTLIAFAALVGGTDTVTFTATGTAGSAGRLAILTQPSATSASGSAFATQPQVQLQDQNGNPLTTTGVAIQATAGSVTLGGTTTVTTVNGVASFTNLSLTGLAGSYTLTFSAANITGVTSSAITLTAGARHPAGGGDAAGRLAAERDHPAAAAGGAGAGRGGRLPWRPPAVP